MLRGFVVPPDLIQRIAPTIQTWMQKAHPTWAELYEAIVPVVSTGGAVLEVAAGMGSLSSDLAEERDYVAHFHRRPGVSVREGRYRDPDAQPATPCSTGLSMGHTASN